MNKSKTVYEAFFGDSIGKNVTISEDGYYHCGDYIPGRFYSGILMSVRCSERGLVLCIDKMDITVSPSAQINIIE